MMITHIVIFLLPCYFYERRWLVISKKNALCGPALANQQAGLRLKACLQLTDVSAAGFNLQVAHHTEVPQHHCAPQLHFVYIRFLF